MVRSGPAAGLRQRSSRWVPPDLRVQVPAGRRVLVPAGLRVPVPAPTDIGVLTQYRPVGMLAGMKTITPCLWFNNDGLEAAEFYVSLFPDSHIDDTAPGPDGSPMMISFTLMGRPFQALNGGPRFVFTEAVSLVVPCDTQAEVDHYWAALTEGGEESMCGWLKDRFGLSWQVVPRELGAILAIGTLSGLPGPCRPCCR